FPFLSLLWGELEADVVTLLKRIQKFSIRAHATVHIFNRISFAIAKGVEPKVFARDISGDHAVSWAGIIGIKHRHNVVRDTFVDICYRSRISVGKEVDIGLDGGGVTNPYVQQICCFTHVIEGWMSIGYGFIPFSFSSLGELEEDAVTLLKRIRNFFMTQDIRARVAVHIFNMIGFDIAKGVEAQIVS
ncbi:hypothetical protein Tco_1488874, partial [Tanacetum coccineum]